MIKTGLYQFRSQFLMNSEDIVIVVHSLRLKAFLLTESNTTLKSQNSQVWESVLCVVHLRSNFYLEYSYLEIY